MYPTLVIVLIETQRSITDVCEIGPSNASKPAGPVAFEARSTTSGHLSFAVGSIHSAIDIEAESQCSRRSQLRGGQEHGSEEDTLEVKEASGGR